MVPADPLFLIRKINPLKAPRPKSALLGHENSNVFFNSGPDRIFAIGQHLQWRLGVALGRNDVGARTPAVFRARLNRCGARLPPVIK